MNQMKKTKKTNILLFIVDFFVASTLTLGFLEIFAHVLENNNLVDVFVIITLPLLIGSFILNNNKFKRQGLIFLFSSLFLIIGFLLMFTFTQKINLFLSRCVFYFGVFVFSWGVFTLWRKVGFDIFEKKEIWKNL